MLTPKQLQERKKGLGGSDAAAACGLSRYKTPLELYNDKTSDIISQQTTRRMEKGSHMEPLLARWYEEDHEIKLEYPPMQWGDQYFMFANIDGFDKKQNAIVEFKKTRLRHEWGEPESDEIPIDYILQGIHYSIVMGIKKVIFAVDFDLLDDSLTYFYLESTEELKRKLFEKEHAFWYDNIVNKVPPMPVSEKEINTYWNVKKDSKIEATEKILTQLGTFLALKKLIKDSEEQQQLIENEIKLHMQHNEILTVGGGTLITWKEQSTNRFDQSTFKADNPDLFNKYMKNSSTRVFRTKEINK